MAASRTAREMWNSIGCASEHYKKYHVCGRVWAIGCGLGANRVRCCCFPMSRRLRCVPMRSSLLCLCLLASSASLSAQSWRNDRAKVCFVRPEDNGAINILESWVRLADYSLPLIGGEAACVFVGPGSYDLLVTSTIPYEPESRNERACKSPVKKLQLAPNDNLTFAISPATKGSSYACGWRIEPVPPAKSNLKKTK